MASIQEIAQKFKSFEDFSDIWVGILILLVGLGSFFLGQSTRGEAVRTGIPVHEGVESERVADGQKASGIESGIPLIAPQPAPGSTGTPPSAKAGAYVGSKNGTKYHLPWCSGALRIKEENKVWFATKEEAEALGYAPASNCKGI